MASSAEELVSCPVCFEPIGDPQLLPCQHTFCKSCVNRIADAGTITCPICYQVCLTKDVNYDFRLAAFMDALVTQTEQLTGARLTNEHAKKRQHAGKWCDLCEDASVAHYCNQCQQWMCEKCSQLHSKGKWARSHTMTSLREKCDDYKANIQHLIQNVDVKTEACQTGVSLIEEGFAEIAIVKSKSIQQCNMKHII